MRGFIVGTMVGLLTFGVNAPAGSASSQPAHGTLVVRILPKSPVEVGNCIPFGNNVDYGFTGFIYRNVHPFTLKVGDGSRSTWGTSTTSRSSGTSTSRLPTRTPIRRRWKAAT